MTLETTPSAPTPELTAVPKERWQPFFDALTKVLEGNTVEIEVIGLDLGDQIETDWLPLSGLTYDSKDHTFYVYLEDQANSMAHAITEPREIFVRIAGRGLEQVVVIDSDDHRNVINLREPLELPSRASS
jgi:hypothetical protein